MTSQRAAVAFVEAAAEVRPFLVAQLGARRHYAVPRAFYSLGRLERLVTDLAAEGAGWRRLEAFVPRTLRRGALAALLARRVDGVPASRIVSLPAFALSQWQRRRPGESQPEHWARRNAAFCRLVARRGFGAAKAVYAFNGAALEIFRAAKAQGLRTVLDQASAPERWYRAMLREEAARWPGWEESASGLDRAGALIAREEEEWQLADRIVCGSAFVSGLLAESGVAPRKCAVVPYGGYRLADRGKGLHLRRGRLRVLFVGRLQLGKGLPYLLEAARLLARAPAEIRLVGPSQLSARALMELGTVMELAGPATRDEVTQHYAWADALVLPTLSEGSANVVYEAMAAGLTVVTTPNAGSVIRDGRDGLIVPARDHEALAAAMLRLASDRELCLALGHAARETIARQSFVHYAARLAAACDGAPELTQMALA
jgi:glycosyltransferase involved in cell wall biosynthesis